MQRVISVCTLLCSFGLSVMVATSCRGGTASASQLPSPTADDRAPGSPPEPPRLSVDLPPAASKAPTRILSQGDDLQDALNAAKPGDVIALAPRAVFKGPITLPKKDGDQWITIRTQVPDGVFPPPGTRVDPSRVSQMPVIESNSDTAITTESGAHHYRLIGIEIRPQSGSFLHNLVALGGSETAVEALPHHLVLERCYLHGDPALGGRRGIALNSRQTAIADSYLSDFKEQGADSQAIAGWNGAGPFAIVNNYLEGAGENVMFGGADPSIVNLVPSDIEVRGNHFRKPLQWRSGDPSYSGTQWTVKNLFELKNARRVRVDGNLFENNWLQAQNGFAILFTPRNQDGGSSWSMVRDVIFTDNILRHTGSGFNIGGTDDIHLSEQTKRILIANNLFQDIDPRWGGSGRLFQLINGPADVVIDHNTAFQSGDIMYSEGTPNIGFAYTNNLALNNQNGWTGQSVGGIAALRTFFPNATFLRNVVIGGRPDSYPPNNYFPPTPTDVGFVDFPGGDYHLSTDSKYKAAATDGKNIGADFDAMQLALDGAARTRRRVVVPAPGRPAVRTATSPNH